MIVSIRNLKKVSVHVNINIWLLICIFYMWTPFLVWSCDIDQHHSILGHYNESDAVFIVQVKKQQSTNERIFESFIINHSLRLRIERTLKDFKEPIYIRDGLCKVHQFLASSSIESFWQPKSSYLVFVKLVPNDKKNRHDPMVFYAIQDVEKINKAEILPDKVC